MVVVVVFSRSVMPNSLWSHGLQHARLSFPSPSPGACSNSCPLSQWCHPTISSSVIPFSSCLQSSPASKLFPMSWLFTLGRQSIGVSASVSVLPMNIQGWFPLGLTNVIWRRQWTTLQYSCLENPMDGGAWWATVHRVTKSWTRLNDFTFTFHFHALEKEMAAHSSVLAWRIPGTGEPGGWPSMGWYGVRHNWSYLAAAAV